MTAYTYVFTVQTPEDEEAGEIATTLAEAIDVEARCWGWQVSPLEVQVSSELSHSAVSDDQWHTPCATNADYAAYAAACMVNMDDTEAVAVGDTLVIRVHDVDAVHAVFTDVTVQP